MTNYNDGKWHGWNGGECPVHPETVVEVQFEERKTEKAGWFKWDRLGAGDIIAFRVIKEHKEPREFWLCEGEVYNDRDAAKYCCGYSEIIHVKEVLE